MMSVLQSITMTLSDVQQQLSIMQEHNDLRDSILKKVEKDVAERKKYQKKHQNSSKVVRVPGD